VLHVTNISTGEDLLQQHLESPAHATSYDCDDCDQSFDTQHALNQQLNSPAHPHRCEDYLLVTRSWSSKPGEAIAKKFLPN
jgi:uncharacterized paraquat-inducible protein A